MIANMCRLNGEQRVAFYIYALPLLDRLSFNDVFANLVVDNAVYRGESHIHEPALVERAYDAASKPALPSMLLLGAGGTGKSAIVHALHRLLTLLRREHTLASMAQSGAASTLLPNGCTIQSMFGFADVADNIADRLVGVSTIVVDEVSMCNAHLFSMIARGLNTASSSSSSLSSSSMRDTNRFGDFGVILTGDFLQLPPVKGASLVHGAGSGLHRSLPQQQQTALKIFQHEIDFTVTLVQSMRCVDDQPYAELMQRLRCASATTADVAMLESRRTPSLASPPVAQWAADPECLFVTHDNRLHDAVNMVRTTTFARLAGHAVVDYYAAHDTLVGATSRADADGAAHRRYRFNNYASMRPVPTAALDFVRRRVTVQDGASRMSFLPVVPGLPAVVLRNDALQRGQSKACVKLGVANGVTGEMIDVVPDPNAKLVYTDLYRRFWDRPPKLVVVRLSEQERRSRRLVEGIVR
jgi:hypothetical protein